MISVNPVQLNSAESPTLPPLNISNPIGICKLFIPEQPINELAPNVVVVSGIINFSIPVHAQNALAPTVSTLVKSIVPVIPGQEKKPFSPISSIFSKFKAPLNPLQLLNAYFPIISNEFGNLNFAVVHPEKVYSPIFFIPSSTVIIGLLSLELTQGVHLAEVSVKLYTCPVPYVNLISSKFGHTYIAELEAIPPSNKFTPIGICKLFISLKP